MTVKPGRPLAPGEIRVHEPCSDGHVHYERLNEQGELERGHIEPVSDTPNPRAVGVVRMGEFVEPGIRKVLSYTPLRSGPAAVSSDAYRTGWEGIFGKKPRAEGLN